MKLLSLQTAWQVSALSGVMAACFISGASPFICFLSLIGIIFVVGVALKAPISQLFGSLFCILLSIISWDQGLLANSLLNAFLLAPMCVYGYTVWKKGVANNSLEKSLTTNQVTIVSLLSAGSTAVLWWLTKDAGGAMPFLDSLTAVAMFVATVIMTLSYKEQWIGWIIVNTSQCYIWWVALAASPDVASVFVMKVIFLLNSLIGWWNWNKNKS